MSTKKLVKKKVDYIKKAKEERNRQRSISKQYFSSTPNISNLWNGTKAFIKSLPVVGVSAADVNPNIIQGIVEAPLPEGAATQRLLKFIGRDSSPLFSVVEEKNLPQKIKAFTKILKDNKIDLSRFSVEDLQKALSKRQKILKESAPERYTLVAQTPTNDLMLYDIQNGTPVGNTLLTRFGDRNVYSIGNVYNLNKGAGRVYQRGLNSAIQTAHSNSLEGILSGEDLISAPKTYHILQPFKNRVQFGNYGIHSNINMFSSGTPRPAKSILDLARTKERAILTDAPVWKITQGTEIVPTKSELFNPNILDENGIMQINWNNPNIYFKNGGSISNK